MSNFEQSAGLILSQMRPATIEEILARQKSGVKHGGSGGGGMTIDEFIQSYDLYAYLKARFGPPNGLTTLFKNNSSDNFINWHYTLISGEVWWEVYGMKTRVDSMLSGAGRLSREEWGVFVDAIKASFRSIGPKLGEVKRRFEEWQLFVNPFCRLDGLVTDLASQLEKLDLDSMKIPEPPSVGLKPLEVGDSKNANQRYFDDLTTCLERYWEALKVSSSLRMLVPVWAEAFINLLILTFAHEEFKESQRLYDDFRRSPIDVRVLTMHLKCRGFAKGKRVDASSDVYKAFHGVMNDRNELLHGNAEPEKSAFRTVYFDGMVPLYRDKLNHAEHLTKHILEGVEPSQTLKNRQAVLEFIEHVLSLLEPGASEAFRQIMDARDLGWMKEGRRVGVLLPNVLIEGFAGF